MYDSNYDSDSDDYVAVISSDTVHQLEPLNVEVQLGKVRALAMIDSGSAVSIITETLADKILQTTKFAKWTDTKDKRNLKTFSNEPIKVLGHLETTITYNQWKDRAAVFTVVEDGNRNRPFGICFQVFKKLDDDNLRINLQKCYFAKTEIEWLGYKFTQTGILPLESKTAAILTIPPPTTLKRLRSFLGSVHYIGKFIPHLAQLCHPLRPLLKKSVKFIWTEEHTKHFNLIKEKIANSTENICMNCGLRWSHNHKQICPANGKKCNNCGITGHFARKYRKPKKSAAQTRKAQQPNVN